MSKRQEIKELQAKVKSLERISQPSIVFDNFIDRSLTITPVKHKDFFGIIEYTASSVIEKEHNILPSLHKDYEDCYYEIRNCIELDYREFLQKLLMYIYRCDVNYILATKNITNLEELRKKDLDLGIVREPEDPESDSYYDNSSLLTLLISDNRLPVTLNEIYCNNDHRSDHMIENFILRRIKYKSSDYRVKVLEEKKKSIERDLNSYRAMVDEKKEKIQELDEQLEAIHKNEKENKE